ncbi:unnamed protein product [Peronospora farinosa]|uniref:CCHC-type domain-containing protein n=1 Tax=Peronospora farinosa TaxID=134698 RepID=A0AAV0UMS1_9STRA|nr:unnamed protein product [Peronospora farinosa]
MSAKKAEVILESDNYFHWEFVMRMTLARKGLTAPIQMVKPEAEMIEAWAWITLREFYNRTTMHNVVTMTLHLHDLSSLPAEYEIIASIVENAKDVTLIEVTEKLLKEYERQDKKEATELAPKDTTHGVKLKNARFDKGGRNIGRKDNVSKKRSGFKGRCFKCDKFGHMKRDCPDMKMPGKDY